MSEAIDELYERILRISTELEVLSQTHPGRERLEREREEIRALAATLASAGRHPVSVEREIASLQRRLKDIEAMRITEGYQERRGGKNLQDPGAYSSKINQLLKEHHVFEVEALIDRITYLETVSRDGSAEDTE